MYSFALSRRSVRFGLIAAHLFCAVCAARPVSAASEWGDWQPVPDRVQAAVDVRLQRDLSSNRDPEVHFQFRNRYGQQVTVGYVIQGEDSNHAARQIDGSVTLDPGEQKLNRDLIRVQTTPFTTLTGIAFPRITFAGIPPRPTAAGSRWESPETRDLARRYESALADVKAAEAAKFAAQDLLVRVQRSEEIGTPLVLSEGQPVKAVMASDDVGKAQMSVQNTKTTEETARRAADAVKERLDESRRSDEAATATRRDLAARLAPTKGWAAAGEWPRVEAALHAALTDPAVTIPDSDRAILELNLGIAQMRQDRPADALTAFTEACRLAPLNGACRCELGAALLSAGRLDDAGDALAEAVRLSPNEASYQFNLGLVRNRQRRMKEAAAAFGEAVRLDPNNAAYRERLKAVSEEK